MRCSNCDKTMRPKHTKAADHPGTVLHRGRGVCATCHARAKAAERGREAKPRKEGPTHCVRCTVPLRKWNETVKDRPGTRANTGNGVCDGCYKKQRAQEAKAGVAPVGTLPDLSDDVYGERRPGVEENRASLEIWLRNHYRVRRVAA